MRRAARLPASAGHAATRRSAVERDAAVEGRLLTLENKLFALETIQAGKRNPAEPTFEEAVIEFFSGGIQQPLFQHYVRYALQSIRRGEKLVAQYKPAERNVRRYLDVGCAYGGAVIAMALAGVPETVGFDVDERLIRLAKLQARQCGLEARTMFATCDLTDSDALAAFGQFDFITCIDVLEHVLDPERAIDNLARIAAPGALALIDVPNPCSYQLIEQDPHHHLFGNVLLDRERAIEVFSAHFAGNKRYTVGYYFPLEWYLAHLTRIGFEVELADDLSKSEQQWPETARRHDRLMQRLVEVGRAQSWPGWRRALLERALTDHLGRFRSDREDIRDPTTLQRRYGIAVYHLRCGRRGGLEHHELLASEPGVSSEGRAPNRPA